MRIKISLKGKDIVLPINYQYFLQALFYSLIRDNYEEFHDEGVVIDEKKMKPFSFSKIFSNNYKIIDKKIYFDDEIYFYFSSPLNDMINVVIDSLANMDYVRIGSNFLSVSYIRDMQYFLQDNMLIKLLSPILVYNTFFDVKGNRKTIYYNPFDKEFFEIIKDNMRTKSIFFNINSSTFDIIPEKVNTKNKRILKYKNTIYEAWDGIYRLRGSYEVLNLIFEWGLGLKNSQGFGMVDTI